MIHFLTGVPGSGKGYVSTIQVEQELATGSRVILTDSALRLDPWLRNVSSASSWSKASKQKFQPELGLLGYLQEKYGETFAADERIFIFGHDEAKEFYLRRYDLKLKKWVVLDAERDAKGRIERFDTLIKTHGSLTITDEFWAAAGSRDWANTAQGLIFYAAQHRKFGDEWFIVTQNTKQIDTALRGLAHDTWVCENHGKKQFGPFRRPDKITVAVYDKIPSGPSASPLRRMVYTLDKRGLGSCFDTAAGTGVSGGGAADLNEAKRGLPFWALCVGVVLVIAALSQTPKFFSWCAGKLLPARHASAVAALVTNAPPAVSSPSSFVGTVAGMFKPVHADAVTNAPEEIKFAGYTFDGSKVTVMFSDGSMRVMTGALRRLPSGRYLVDGEEYAVHKPTPGPVPYPASLPPILVYESVPEESRPTVSVTVIGKREEIKERNMRENFHQNR